MTKEQKNFASKIKCYHILILGCILAPLIIINSNYVNKQRAEDKLNEEKRKLFDNIVYGRKLEGEEESEKSDSKSDGIDEVCNRGSEELRAYYKSGNLGDIKIEEGGIKSEDKDKDYMKALINILKSQFKGDGNEEDGEDNNDGDPPAPENGRRNLNGEEEEKDDKEGESQISNDDLIAYGKHLIPVLVFLVVAILCIPGWIMCCFCCCCNCCCCCCCKKPCCKIPCFVITFALYALVVAVCIYGLSQSNHIFVGLADTECSILRFFEEISEGEIKTEPPRWAGFEGISKILNGLSTEIGEMEGNAVNQLDAQINNITNQKGGFLNLMESSGGKFYQSSDPPSFKTDYSASYSYSFAEGNYVLDLIKMFGKYNIDSHKYEPKNSLLDTWEFEYKTVSETADHFMEQARDGFDNILTNNIETVKDSLKTGQDTMDQLKGTFNDIKGPISDIIVDNSRTIDDYGKLGVKAVFGVLALIDVAIAAFMLLLCFCSGKCCTKCCCCRCICKLFTHLLWNLLALLMIIVFLVGTLFALIGKIGSDAMSVLSYVLSEDNIGEGGDGVLIDQLGEDKRYLTRCLIGDGKIEEELGLGDSSINSFDDIKTAEKQIADSKKIFIENKDYHTYKLYKGELEKRANLTAEKLCLIKKDAEIDLENIDMNSQDILSFFKILAEMNNEISNTEHHDSWSVENGDKEKICNEGDTSQSYSGDIIFHPQSCYPTYRDWIKNLGTTQPDITGRAKIIGDTLTFIKNAEKNSDNSKDYLKIINDLKVNYEIYLDAYIVALDKFNSTINQITSQLNDYTGDSSLFSFAKCSFIGTNLKIILKYLKESLGVDVYTIGVCLILVGCSLALSISFTILLIVIINADIDKNKETKI